MARKTKAEQLAEIEAARAAQRELDASTYTDKLMAALEEATQKSNYELTVFNGMFELKDRDDSYNDISILTISYTPSSLESLIRLQWDLNSKAYAMRRQALIKLTKEEQVALGLNDRNNC